MIKTRIRILLTLLGMLLMAFTGCTKSVPCDHTLEDLHEAVFPSFFSDGNIAYYQCTVCEALFDDQKAAVETVVIPKLSSNLAICVNEERIPMLLIEQNAEHITWQLEGLSVSKGNRISICDSTDQNTLYAYTAQGNLNAEGRIKTSACAAVVTLTATREGLALSISEDTHPGVLAEINGKRYPMHPISDGYAYGYVDLKAGNRFTVVDNQTSVTYGYTDISADCVWNRYDFHCGENGELVIDRDGRYQLKLSKDGKLSVTKVFAPRADGEYQVVLSSEKSDTVAMGAVEHASMQWDLFAWYATHEYTENNADIAAAIANNATYAYSSVLQLKEGTSFYLKSAETAEKITGEHVTQVVGSTDCVELYGDDIQIKQTGVYQIQYLPSCDSIWVKKISVGDFKEAAAQLDRKIVLIPSGVEQYYAGEIKALYEEYLLLSPYVKYRIKASGKLETLYSNVLAWESTPAMVTYYMNTDSTRQVYPSKEALFRAFYTDYYYYIAVYHGTDALKTNGVKSLGDFLKLAQDLNGAGFENLSGFGYIANKYFLISSSNNILENQPDDAFLGFCYQNGLYEELLPFLLRFFAYWRIDERYANSSNHGADPFIEPWATTVDIAKFFYYNEETSYVKTKRVLDCHTNTAGVIYGLDDAVQLPQIKLRGYIFEGWFDNPECSGNPVSKVDSGGERIRLYAKWTPDDGQRDADAASLVDIYLYNLTTKPARRTKTTVGYVKNMYDALSEQGKALVKETDTLQNLMKQFRLDSES